MKTKQIFAVTIAFFVANTLFALSGVAKSSTTNDFLSDFESSTWTTEDGLPGNTINNLVQNEQGFLYIGTYDGLVRFDGVEFITLNRSYNEKYNFTSTRSLFKDSQGNIWVGSNDEGIAKIAPDSSVKMFTVHDGLPNNSIRAIQEDLDGNIWVGTASGVVFITSAETGEKIVTPKGLDAFGEEHILVATLYCDTAGRIWLTSRNPGSIYVFADDAFSRYENIKSVENPTVNVITQDARGAFWFGLSPHHALKIDSGIETLYDIGAGLGKQAGTIVNSIMQDKTGNMWFALDSGIAILHEGKLSFYNQQNGLVDNSINRILQDREGNIWLATDRAGLEKLSLSKFKTVPLGTTVNAIAEEEKSGLVYLGADNGLYCYDGALRKKENFITDYCKSTRIRHVGFTKSGDLLVSTYEKFGQLKFSKNNDGTFSVQSWTSKNGLTGNKVRVAIEASNGDLYIGTTTGLNIIDGNTGSITTFTHNDSLLNEYIMCIFEDSNGTIWVGTDGGGVFTLRDKKIDTIYTSTYTKKGDATITDETCLVGNVVFKISEMKNNEFWFCTGIGISVLKDGKFFNFNSSSGLGIDSIFQIINEYNNVVWMTSNRGISCAKLSQFDDMAQGKISKINTKFFSSSDGIHSSGVSSTSLSMKDNLGRIWFTMTDGFVVYDPLKTTAEKISPLVQIDKIIVDGKELNYEGEQIVLSKNAKRLIIKFTAPSFVSPDQMLFCYELSPFEANFCAWTNERTVSYTNLKPGNYEFMVMAQGANEIESSLIAPFKITKKPYFWQRWFFWPLLVLVVALVIGFIILSRIMRMKRYQKILEKEVDRQTAEIRQKSHDLEIEKNKADRLLLNILPQSVANQLSSNPNIIIAEQHEHTSILFSDIVGFTKLSSSMTPSQVVNMLNDLFTLFDLRAEREGVEKIKTIGDSYMAVCGLNSGDAQKSATKMIKFALGMLEDLQNFNTNTDLSLQMRIGINTGTIVAGVIGKTKFIYDIWGDSVNIASRMESSGKADFVHVTESTYLAAQNAYKFDEPTEIDVKGKGMMKTYFLHKD